MTRTTWIISGALATLLVIVAILLIVIIGQNNAARAQEDHDRVVAACSEDLDDPWGRDLNTMLACMQRLEQ